MAVRKIFFEIEKDVRLLWLIYYYILRIGSSLRMKKKQKHLNFNQRPKQLLTFLLFM